MSNTQRADEVMNLYTLRVLVSKAVANAETTWDTEFIANISEKLDKFGGDMFLSDKQLALITKMADE